MRAGLTDTAAAIATAIGQSALAIVRVSGDEAVSIAGRVFRGARLDEVASHTAHFGYVEGGEGEDVDQVVATVFRAPRSSTGEDVVEITCHGGDFAAQMILRELIAAGARMAAPGEFTQRAFVNGKIDLAQAEAIADLIHASSTAAHRASLSHLKGRYSSLLEKLRSELLELAAFVELELDFSDEDVEFADRPRLEALLHQSDQFLERLVNSYQVGEKVRQGIRVVIGGRPNAGKSTLLNALVGYDRAIVSPTPGTTRDEIEAEAEIEGLRFRFVDTAGLRATQDAIEAEGVRRARASIDQADVLVYVFDAQEGLAAEEEEVLEDVRSSRGDLPMILVRNKADLVLGRESIDDSLSLSALEANHDESMLEPLVRRMLMVAGEGLTSADSSTMVMNQRHLQHLRGAREAIQRAAVALEAGSSGDTLSLDLRIALDELGAITGAITNEDVLDQIFSRFCIGK